MKKVLSIVLSLVMVLCLTPAMAFADSNGAVYSDISGEKCEGAVNVLDALGVIDGYEDGTYRPDQVVTRAEMAKLVITALGIDSYATATTSSYSDMQNAQWAIPVVEYATNLGIVEGVGDGRFSPGNPVTYEQAVTMIVRALGYTTDCNEMNGTWPAIYVQKATALGIFRNVEGSQYGTGANRGDIAIMLYNALELPQVYADKDGATLPKTGEDGQGVTMMNTLNKDGGSSYEVVTSQMANTALTNIREYIGAAAKVTVDKNGDVLAVGDIKTTFLTGKVSSDGKNLVVDDVEYALPTSMSDYVDIDSKTGGKGSQRVVTTEDGDEIITGGADAINNGETQGVVANKLAKDDKVTIAAKVSGKTIKEIYSVATWTATDADMVSESQINTISSKKTLLGYDFTLNDDREIDTTSFELIGVDSLDDIEKDDVVYVYTAGDDKDADITRVAVGQETVTGELEKIANKGTAKAKYTIDGTEYKLAANEAAGITGDSTDYSIAQVNTGDSVTITLDAYGNIYKLEADSANRLYAAVLKTGVTTDAYGETTYSIQFLDAEGNTVTANVDSDYADKFAQEMGITAGATEGEYEGYGKVADKTIVKYHLNSSDEIDYIDNVTVGDQVKNKVSSSGYYDGYALASNVVIFSYNGTDYSKADNYTVVTRDNAIGKEFTASYALNSDEQIILMIADDLVASDVVYGLVTGSGENNSDAGNYVDILTVDGETVSYDCAPTVLADILDMAGTDKQNLIGFKVSSNNEIKDGKVAEVESGIEGTLGGDDVLLQSGKVTAIANGRITIDGESYAYTDDVVIYKYDADDEIYKTDGSTSDIVISDDVDTYVDMFDITGEDSVYDVIVIRTAARA